MKKKVIRLNENDINNLVSKILRESDFDWAENVKPNQHLDKYINDWWVLASEVYSEKEVINYDADEDEYNLRDLSDRELKIKRQNFYDLLAQNIFTDTEVGGKGVLLKIYDFDDLSDLFEDTDTHYGYIGRSVAKGVIGGDDLDWEPYWDTYSDWEDDVWDITTDENKKYVYDVIKDRYIGEETNDGEEFTEEVLNEWINNDDVGSFIDTEDFLSDIKSDLGGCHNRAYNDVARNQIYESVHGAIEDVLGSFEWGNVTKRRYRDGKYEDYQESAMVFDITGIFGELVDTYMTEWCAYDNIGDYDSNCDLEYSSFIGLLSFIMYELDYYGGLLNPRYDEYPDYREVEKYYNEGIGDYM